MRRRRTVDHALFAFGPKLLKAVSGGLVEFTHGDLASCHDLSASFEHQVADSSHYPQLLGSRRFANGGYLHVVTQCSPFLSTQVERGSSSYGTEPSSKSEYPEFRDSQSPQREKDMCLRRGPTSYASHGRSVVQKLRFGARRSAGLRCRRNGLEDGVESGFGFAFAIEQQGIIGAPSDRPVV